MLITLKTTVEGGVWGVGHCGIELLRKVPLC